VEQRILGSSGIRVGSIGLGCMGMSDFYGPTNDTESLATLNLALDRGANFLDTADMYGFGKNEELVGQVARERLGVHFGGDSTDGQIDDAVSHMLKS